MNIYVGNLSPRADEHNLRALFEEHGKVSSVKILMNMESGQSLGYGFVEMDDDRDAQKAITKLNNLNYMELFLDVAEAKPRPAAANKFMTDAQNKKAEQQKRANNSKQRRNS